MKEIIENVKLVENAPLEEPARQYYFMEKAKEYVAENESDFDNSVHMYTDHFHHHLSKGSIHEQKHTIFPKLFNE